MLRKLLKYDFSSIIKLWIIPTITVYVLSFPVGYAIRLTELPRDIPLGIQLSSILGTAVLALGLFVYLILTAVLIFKRFYKNFFTDEGYLTFTLPVKRNQLLFSKVLFGTITYSATIFVFIATIINLLLMSYQPSAEPTETTNIIASLNDGLCMGTSVSVMYVLAVILLIFAIFVLFNCISVIFMYLCITIASMVAKKNKVLSAVGIYYLSNSTVSFFAMLFMLFGLDSIFQWTAVFSEKEGYIFFLLVLFLATTFLALISTCFYLIIYRMLDKKLNLT